MTTPSTTTTTPPTPFECGSCGNTKDEGTPPDVFILADPAQPPGYGRVSVGLYRIVRRPWLEILDSGWPGAIIPQAVERLGEIPAGMAEFAWGFAFLCRECRGLAEAETAKEDGSLPSPP